jgi:ABC-type nitrate/sulfonate/bicarbonate transport system ATPase subunit
MKDRVFRLESVSLSFGVVEVLHRISLEIVRGEFVAIVGPSGCGKTTLLNVLSGHDRPSSGVMEREGYERMIYQQDGLFPWRTVWENIALGLRDLKNQRERDRKINELVKLIRLEGFEHHYPHQLSGGMRQRVELARALAGDSETLLMDEPFSSLDYLTRIRMREELARILQERPRTVVLVTHDIEEAAQLADRVIVLTERPAQIRQELTISTPRPRGLTHSEVVRATNRILTELGMQSETEEVTVGLGRSAKERE